MKIDPELLEWIDNNPNFSNRSHGVRYCIRVAKRVIEGNNAEDIMRYWNGIEKKE